LAGPKLRTVGFCFAVLLVLVPGLRESTPLDARGTTQVLYVLSKPIVPWTPELSERAAPAHFESPMK